MNIEKHGGQDNHVSITFKQDFSVTTNYLGASAKGKERIADRLGEIEHYPNQTFEPYISNLRDFLFKGQASPSPYMMLGNGASELIDLVIRNTTSPSWKPSQSAIQFMEYERSAKTAGKTKSVWNDKDAKLTCIINPNNPTGEYLGIEELKAFIEEHNEEGSHVLVDESMQPWNSEDWRADSLVSQTAWISDLASRGIYVYIIHSWTKIFTCTGLRYGSMICPTKDIYSALLQKQVPWTCNVLALEYVDECIRDDVYLKTTWTQTRVFREYQIKKLQEHFPQWTCYGAPFLSWIWIDVHDVHIAKLAYKLAKYNGTPIRYGGMGYKMTTCIRIAVREREHFDDLLEALLELKIFQKSQDSHKLAHIDIQPDVICEFKWVSVDRLLPHEEFIPERHSKLHDYLKSIDQSCSIPAIIVCSETYLVIDGHHRLSVMKKLGIEKIPCLLVNYQHKDIIVNPYQPVTKDAVIQSATEQKFLAPKSTAHMIVDKKGTMHPIQVLSPVIFLIN